MKKLLLSLAIVAAAGSMQAKTWTIDKIDMTTFTAGTVGEEGSEKDTATGQFVATDGTKFDVVLTQGNTSTAISGMLGVNNQLRWYKNYTLQITMPEAVGTIKQMIFNCPNATKNGNWQYCASFTVADVENANVVVSPYVSGGEATVTYTNEEGFTTFEAEATVAQIRVNSLVISDEAGDVVTPPAPEVKEVATVAEFKALCAATNGPKVKITSPLTASYQNGRYLFLQDVTGAMMVYGDITEKYNNGDVVPAGITGIATLYSDGIYQLATPEAATFGAATAGTAVAAKAITCSEVAPALCSQYVVLKNVSITAIEDKANNYTVADEEGDECLLFNQFTNEAYYNVVTVEEGEGLDLYAMVTVYKGAAQLYPVKIVKDSEGIGAVATENAPAVYFNLQGIRVENPAAGQIYIRRQGTKATKVIVK